MKANKIYHYCHISVKNSMSMDTRRLTYTDLTFVLKGRLSYAVDGTEYILEQGDALCVGPGSLESRKGLKEPVEYVSFNFDAEDLNLELFMKGVINPAIKGLTDIYPAQHMYDCEEATEEKCLYMLNYILLELEDSGREKSRFYSRVSQYVNVNITRPISLSDISHALGVTKEYLATAFKKESGKTVTDYINSQKMALASSLVRNGEMSLCEIAEYLGYNNYNYFCRVFKKTFGTSPTKMRFHD